MSEQGDDAVNPGQAIYDALSDEAKAAVDTLPNDIFMGSNGLVAASWIVEAIQLANQANVNCWSVLADKESDGKYFVSFIVNHIVAVDINKGRLGPRFYNDSLDVNEKDWLDQVSEGGGQHKSLPISWFFVPFSLASNLAESYKGKNLRLVTDTASKNWAKSAHWYKHRDEWRVKLALITGEELPVPAYVPNDRIGLPMNVPVETPSRPEAATQRYWKISAGRAAVDWPLFRDESIIALSWYDELFDPTELPTDEHEFSRELQNAVAVSAQGARSIWQFRSEMDVDDAVLVYSNRTVIAQGVVTDGYSFDANAPDYRHRRTVAWQTTEPRSIRDVDTGLQNKLSLQQTLIELTSAEFYAVTSNLSNAALPVAPVVNLGGALTDGFASAGLTYTPSQIASFYTALQTKGFVILSGISGTGKSKIAQRFAEMLPKPIGTRLDVPPEVADSFESLGFHLVKVQNYMAKFQRFYIPVEISRHLPLPEPGTAFNVPIRINEVQGEARIRIRGTSGAYVFPKAEARTEFVSLARQAGSFFIRFSLDEESDLIKEVQILSDLPEDNRAFKVHVTNASLQNKTFGFPWKDASTFPFPEVHPAIKIPVQLPSGARVEGRLENANATSGGNGIQLGLKNDAQAFIAGLAPGDQFRVIPLIYEEKVAELRLEFSDAYGEVGSSPGHTTVSPNHLFLSVRPDWRDGKALIGYRNPLQDRYERTSFLNFVIAAGDDYDAGNRNAFFVILDEMNLAHVEYYFADVLSVIESGRDEDGWTVEGISLAVKEQDSDLPETLRLPPNLYIVGTVNMDETTHPFSPKVLDRAFTIELTEVDFTDYPPEQLDSGDVDENSQQALLRAFIQRGRYPRIDKGDIREVVDRHGRFGVDLQNLNTSLRRSRMHFGYRVFDEIMQFVFSAEENGLFIANDAFDQAVLMKVLPKFNGSRAKLQTALFELLHWCHTTGTMSAGDRAALESRFATLSDGGRPFDSVVTQGSEAAGDDWRYPATGRRAALMMQDLYTDGFAAFG